MIIPFAETERINRLILLGSHKGMTELQFFAAEIREWKQSEKRKQQIAGGDYYEGRQDILKRQRTIIGEDGALQAVKNLPNNRLVDNQYAMMVDQKVNYLVGKPVSFNCLDQSYTEMLNRLFKRKFHRILKYLCEDALKGGIGWLYPYYDGHGELGFQHFPACDVLPFWADEDHTELDCAIRLCPQEVWDGYEKKSIERVELFRKDGIHRYFYENDMLIPDVEGGEHENYFYASEKEKTTDLNWDRIPLIPFKYNKQELPLLSRVKCLQDAINTMLSDFENNMQEDARNTILVLKNYDGQDLGEFRRNLTTYGAVKVRDDGGVETLTVDVTVENYKGILELLKKALIENARGYNASELRSAGTPNQMNIKSVLNDLDLDANQMETEFQAAFEQLLWFVNQDLANKGLGNFDSKDVTVVFNRDTIINDTEVIAGLQQSVGILSMETLTELHPWVDNTEAELDRLRKEKEEAFKQAQEYTGAFKGQREDEMEKDS